MSADKDEIGRIHAEAARIHPALTPFVHDLSDVFEAVTDPDSEGLGNFDDEHLADLSERLQVFSQVVENERNRRRYAGVMYDTFPEPEMPDARVVEFTPPRLFLSPEPVEADDTKEHTSALSHESSVQEASELAAAIEVSEGAAADAPASPAAETNVDTDKSDQVSAGLTIYFDKPTKANKTEHKITMNGVTVSVYDKHVAKALEILAANPNQPLMRAAFIEKGFGASLTTDDSRGQAFGQAVRDLIENPDILGQLKIGQLSKGAGRKLVYNPDILAEPAPSQDVVPEEAPAAEESSQPLLPSAEQSEPKPAEPNEVNVAALALDLKLSKPAEFLLRAAMREPGVPLSRGYFNDRVLSTIFADRSTTNKDKIYSRGMQELREAGLIERAPNSNSHIFRGLIDAEITRVLVSTDNPAEAEELSVSTHTDGAAAAQELAEPAVQKIEPTTQDILAAAEQDAETEDPADQELLADAEQVSEPETVSESEAAAEKDPNLIAITSKGLSVKIDPNGNHEIIFDGSRYEGLLPADEKVMSRVLLALVLRVYGDSVELRDLSKKVEMLEGPGEYNEIVRALHGLGRTFAVSGSPAIEERSGKWVLKYASPIDREECMRILQALGFSEKTANRFLY